MNRLQLKTSTLVRRKHRIRNTVTGTPERPRFTVHVSNKHISAQIIDDSAGKTIVAASTVGQKATGDTMSDKAAWVGAAIAKKAKTAKITKVVFDRNGRLYHGRVKALADAARAGGLEF